MDQESGGNGSNPRTDYVIACRCGYPVGRQDAKEPKVIRFKEKDFYLEVHDPKTLFMTCRRCGRRLKWPYREKGPDIVAQGRKLEAELEDRRRSRTAPPIGVGDSVDRSETT